MSKFIPADKLIAEIERRIGLICTTEGVVQRDKLQEYEALTDIEDFVTSLQQEQSELPGIEEPGIPGKDFIPVEWVDACEMYGKWKIVKQEQPSLPSNLDEAAEEYEHNLGYYECINQWPSVAFKAGAEWMAEQEQPKSDLEEEIEKQIRSIFYDLDGIAIMGTSKYASVEDMEYIARYFYELGRARKEE